MTPDDADQPSPTPRRKGEPTPGQPAPTPARKSGDDEPAAFVAKPREKAASRRRAPAEPPAEPAAPPEDEAEPSAAPEGYEVVEVPQEESVLNAGPRSQNKQSVPNVEELRRRLAGHVCPFCGSRNVDGRAPCQACGLTDGDATRSATIRRVGPWFLRRDNNPHAPGMKFVVLRELTKSGAIGPDSVVRGPTTRQMWTFAARIRGLAHLFGLCWNCNRHLPKPRPGDDPDDFCLYCGALIEPPGNPDQQLEVAETSESIGVTQGGGRAGQTAAGRNPIAKRSAAAAAERGTGRRQASVKKELGQAVAHPGAARRVESKVAGEASTTPRGIPPSMPTASPRTHEAKDGGDALLTTGELATAFNLDRKTSGWTLLGRLPWGWIIAVLAVLGAAAAAFVLAGQQVREALGI